MPGPMFIGKNIVNSKNPPIIKSTFAGEEELKLKSVMHLYFI